MDENLRECHSGWDESEKKIATKNPGKLTWNPNMEAWNVMFFFSWVICSFHVNFQGYTCH